MSLIKSKPSLEKAIFDAFEKAFQTAKDGNEEDKSSKIRKDLSIELANAIHNYVISADVDITPVMSTVQAGIPVVTTPASGQGLTAATGTATHNGLGNLQ